MEKKCEVCGMMFTTKPSAFERRKTCSKRCFGIRKSILKSGKNSYQWSRSDDIRCASCGKPISIKPSHERSIFGNFCSRKCMGEYRKIHCSRENHPRWLGGVTFHPYCPKFNKEFKNRVRAYFNNTCPICGTPETYLVRKLSVHHVESNKQTCCDNSKPLFIPMCGSCHSKISSSSDRENMMRELINIIEIYYGSKCFYTQDEFQKISEGVS